MNPRLFSHPGAAATLALSVLLLSAFACGPRSETAALAEGPGPDPGRDPAAGRAATSEELGRVEFEVTGSPEARRWFERGVAALHSFWYDEAADAFRRARELDPGLYMATWGEAMTHNHPVWDQVELEEGREALARLAPTPEERAALAPTERERAWMAAVEILFPAPGDGADAGDPEKAARDEAYAEAMGALAERFPDVESRAFHDLALQGIVYGGDDETRRFPLLMRSAGDLEALFDDHPDHPGVLHYLIHAYDDPVHAPLGLRAAERYAEVAPAAHHALHMPSHIFVQIGRWPAASSSNEDAWAASVDWVERRDHPPGRRDFHSLSWLLYSYLQQGRIAKAEETLGIVRKAVEEGSGNRAHHARTDMEARFLVETEGDAPVSLLEGEHADSRTALAVALAAHRAGDAAALARAAEWMEEEGSDGAATGVRKMEIDGLRALADGKTEEGLALLERAVEAESELGPPSGPPDTVKPAHELLGEVLLGLDRPEDALSAFEGSLRRTPRRARSVLGAARAAAAAGREGAAVRHYGDLMQIWHEADPGLKELQEARDHVEAGERKAS